MADVKSIPEAVDAAEKEMWGDVAQAQSLVALYRDLNDGSPYACLASSVMERLCDSIEAYHGELLRHGVPPLSERLPAEMRTGPQASE
jgi:hypothetical protein